MIQQKNAQNSVIVYSRSWCPFCNDVCAYDALSSVVLTVSLQMRQLLGSYKIEAKFVELDNIGVPVSSACDPLTLYTPV